MIKTRNLVILAAVLVVLIAVNVLQKSSHRKETAASPTEVVLDGEFSKDNIGRVTLGYGAGEPQVVLENGPQGWLLASQYGARANDQRVAALLRNLSGVSGEFRSDSGDVLGDYGLQEDQCVTVHGYDKSGQEAFALHLGNTPQGFPGQFIRVPGSNRVFVSQKALLSHMGIYGEPAAPTARHFLELQAVKEDREDIDALAVRNGDSVLELEKEFGTIEPAEGSPEGTEPSVDRSVWEWLEDGRPATDLAKTKVDGVLFACLSIRATDVADPGAPLAEYGLDSPGRSVTLTRGDGSTLLLEFGADREASEGVTAGTFMRVDGGDTIWVVTEYTLKNIFKDRAELSSE